MLGRCYEKANGSYYNYGGRGITVCERYHTFENLLEDIGERPTQEYTLDRIHSNGNYEPGNVRWATRKEQALNRRLTKVVKVGKKYLPVAEAARKFGVRPGTAHSRLRAGWPTLEAVKTLPYKRTRKDA